MLPIDSGTIASVGVSRIRLARIAERPIHVHLAEQSDDDVTFPSRQRTRRCAPEAAPGKRRSGPSRSNARPGRAARSLASAPSGALPAAPVFFWQRITYSFRASAIYPNRLGTVAERGGRAQRRIDGAVRHVGPLPFLRAAATTLSTRRAAARFGDPRPRPRAWPRKARAAKSRDSVAVSDWNRDVSVLQERHVASESRSSPMKFPLAFRTEKASRFRWRILVITALTAALAAGFASVASEYTTNAAERGQNRGLQSRADGARAVHRSPQPKRAGA